MSADPTTVVETDAAIWRHECPFAGDGEIDENCPAILDCRCFEGPAFLSAQDAMAVKLDLNRIPGQR